MNGTEEATEAEESSATTAATLDCPICHRLLYEPCVVPCCGQAYCRPCLSEHARHSAAAGGGAAASSRRGRRRSSRRRAGGDGGGEAAKCPTCRADLRARGVSVGGADGGDGGAVAGAAAAGTAAAAAAASPGSGCCPAPARAFAELLESAHPDAYRQRGEEEKVEAEVRAKLAVERAKKEEEEEEGEEEFVLGAFVLDPILPGQTMELSVFEPRYLELMRRCLGTDDTAGRTDHGSRLFAMVGSVPSPGEFGTEVEIVGPVRENNLGTRMLVTVKGRRVFRVVEGWRDQSWGHWEARVRYDAGAEVDGAAAPAEVAEEEEGDAGTIAGAARELDGLVESWEAAVTGGGWERFNGQLAGVRNDLGPMPPVGEPSRRAVWVAAYVNPLPGLGVAREVRPAVLAATGDVGRQIRIVREAVIESGEHMRSSHEASRAFRKVVVVIVLLLLMIAVFNHGWPLSLVFPAVEPYATWLGESRGVQWLRRVDLPVVSDAIKSASPVTSEL